MNTLIYFSLEKWSKRPLKPSDFLLKHMLFLPCSSARLPNNFHSKMLQMVDLMHLVLNDCQLVSLQQFPKMKWLMRLELKNNRIIGKQLRHLVGLEQLVSLWLSRNLIERVEEVSVLAQLPQLLQLDLKGNPLRHTNNYLFRVFDMMPNLLILDDRDCEGDLLELYKVIDSSSGGWVQVDDDKKESLSFIKRVKGKREKSEEPKGKDVEMEGKSKNSQIVTKGKEKIKKPLQAPKVPLKIFKQEPIQRNRKQQNAIIIQSPKQTVAQRLEDAKPAETPEPSKPETVIFEPVQTYSSSDIDLSD